MSRAQTSLDRPVADDEIAGQTDLPLLITATSRREIEDIARRVHLAGSRAGAPFRGRPASTARLITGTTVSLFDRVTAGTFSDRLFYRLNSLHLVAPPQWRTDAAGAGPDER